jgi:hypothetical protein
VSCAQVYLNQTTEIPFLPILLPLSNSFFPSWAIFDLDKQNKKFFSSIGRLGGWSLLFSPRPRLPLISSLMIFFPLKNLQFFSYFCVPQNHKAAELFGAQINTKEF